ncbi:toxin of the RelE-RelB toxin-antitoxin system; Qin prophage [uncultured delta proteobacterium]|uniref:Toxin of the RelE-RelB toxin-antitoxin system Qin prophage n=1 Tax=uncultured delta proteobacterium TaxID=34034 RepID=A0A212JX81_9DELT|nr:toxin of the RelE-RelB toxin-antitoxin system; Qin prophage [uncultured delta proteobacterium]
MNSGAQKEWNKLAPGIRVQLARVVGRCLENPRVPSAALHGMKDCYKIKLRDAGYRLVYRVEDAIVTISVIAVGRRDEGVYANAVKRQ